MDWKWLYTSFDGRISRKQFWIGAIVLAVISIVVSFGVASIMGVSLFGMAMMSGDVESMLAQSTQLAWINLIIYLIFCWPGYALAVKRRHDRGATGILVLISIGLGVLTYLLQGFGLGYDVTDMGNGVMVPMPSMISSVLGVISGLLGLYLLVVLGFLKGYEGENAYGPDPLA